MAHRLVEVDPAGDAPPLALGGDEDGVGVVVRHRGAPVAFFLEELEPGARIDPEAFDRLVGARAGLAIVRAGVRDALAHGPAPDGPGPEPPVPSMTVAVCTHGRPELLAPCLESIERSMLDAGGVVDLVVIDNAPTDGRTADVIEASPIARRVVEPLAGLDFARNRALAEATGEIVAFVDDDVEVERDWVRAMRAALADDPLAGGCTGLVLPWELATDAQVRFERRGGFRRGHEPLRHPAPSDPARPLYPLGAGMFGAGCNMAFRREVLVALGGFDDALDTGRTLPGGGDIDMFFRVVRAGWPMRYEPAAVVRHKHRPDHATLRRQYRSWGTGFMAFLTKTARERPEDRAQIARMVAWWFQDQVRWAAHGALGNHGMTVDLAVAELVGGVVGLAGEYERSQRRVARIRASVPEDR
jgi:GT2 family glycosyltransferase